MEADSINLVDKSKKMYVRIKLSNDRKNWEKWTSTNKKKWELAEKMKSLEDVLKSQQDLIDKNYKNLFDVITKK
jgi:predicted phage gp36 major capsid-like protein